MMKRRPPAVAGSFYTGNAEQLATEVDAMLAGAEEAETGRRSPKALIAPHAGHIYSGPTAARGYRLLDPDIVKRVVLFGPTHRAFTQSIAAPTVEAFETPLGAVELDRNALESLHGMAQVTFDDHVHTLEHSLEVHLPFLQRHLGEFWLVPLAVGTVANSEVSEVMERLWGEKETVILISSDLSHFHSYNEARDIDNVTIHQIVGGKSLINHEQACGATAINALTICARNHDLKAELVAQCNSGDTAGPHDRVVGYATIAFYEQ